VKVLAVKPSPSGQFRYRFEPRLVEEVLCGGASRVNVPLRHAGPVRTSAEEGIQVVERHLYAQSGHSQSGRSQSESSQSGQWRAVSFFPSRRLGLVAREEGFRTGRSVPEAEPIRYARPGGDPGANPYVRPMKRREPTDLRAWSTRLWAVVEGTERTRLHELSVRQMRESGARLDGLQFHPGRSGLYERAFRGMWNRAWKQEGFPYQSNPAVMSLSISAMSRSYPECVSREVGGPDGDSPKSGVRAL